MAHAAHDPAVHTLARARGCGVVVGADADALFACFRDFGGWQRWLPGTAFDLVRGGRGTEVGAVRVVVFAAGVKFLYERLVRACAAQSTPAGAQRGRSRGAAAGR